MATQQRRKVSLGDDFGPVVVEANGAKVVIEADGRFHAANDRAAKGKTAPEIGDEMPDGTIYAGISPDTGKPFYAKPKDEPGVYSFNQTAAHFKQVAVHVENVGDGFRVPTVNELNVLYENHNKGKLKGTFNETDSYPAAWYWSSSRNTNGYECAKHFRDGYQNFSHWIDFSSLRLVR